MLLKRARAFQRRGLCRSGSAETRDGQVVTLDLVTRDCVAFCPLGALAAAAGGYARDGWNPDWDAAAIYLQNVFFRTAPRADLLAEHFEGREATKAEAIALFDRAIELLAKAAA